MPSEAKVQEAPVVMFPRPETPRDEVPFVEVKWFADGRVSIRPNAESAPKDAPSLLRFLGSLTYVVFTLTRWAETLLIQHNFREQALMQWLADAEITGKEN